MKKLASILFFFFSLSAFSQSFPDFQKDSSLFNNLKFRNIGPFRGGRSVCATGVVNDPQTYYMGTTGGGLWKTNDAGHQWKNVSDGYFKTGTVGAVAVAENDANVVYVGMGEHAPRGVMTSFGDGVYKSTDAGQTWKNMGLIKTQHISRIVIHPKNEDILLVGAQGPLHGPSAERGIFKSTDGGKNWTKTLYINETTGCSELSLDPTNPRIIYAAMWDHGRKPWEVKSGGPGSGFYKSTDGGDTWVKLTEGLPKLLGKTAIAMCPSNPQKVYALLEADWEKNEGGLYVSMNGGKKWSLVSGDHRLIQRSWYYIELFVDPNNDLNVYIMSAPALNSTDGGVTWSNMSGTHGDYHDLWINPKNSKNMIIADDGGAAVSFNGGSSWSHQDMATAQVYRINTDNLLPYNIYVGQQDNTSVKIPSWNISGSSIERKDWEYSAGGESAFLAFDPNNPRYVLGGSYQGTIEVLDTRNKSSVNVMAAPIQYLGKDAKDMKYRFNWNAPIICSIHDPKVFYHGSQMLLETSDLGKTWREASPDLTRNEKAKQGKAGVPFTNEAVGAENYGTLTYIAESALEKGVIYTGSDDGLVQVTTDNGKTWKNVTPAGLEECQINAIEVSPHSKSTVYIATNRYKFNDHKPGFYKSTDYGKTWIKINNGLPENSISRVIREDNVQKDLLFAGTENALYYSTDGGGNWKTFQLNLPVCPITDLKIHKNALIAGTSGRSIWILDDLNLLRQLLKETPKKHKLFSPQNQWITASGSVMNQAIIDFKGEGQSAGINPATGLVLNYYVSKTDSVKKISLNILDSNGKNLRTLSSEANPDFKKYDGGPSAEPKLPKNKGLNRFVWDMRTNNLPGIPDVYIEGSYRGYKLAEGKYQIQLIIDKDTLKTQAELLSHPDLKDTNIEKADYLKTMAQMHTNIKDMHEMINELYKKQLQLSKLKSTLTKKSADSKLIAAVDSLIKDLKAWDEALVQRKSKAYDDVENFPNKFTSDYLYLINQTENDWYRLNQPSIDLRAQMDPQWQSFKEKGLKIKNERLPELNKKLWEANYGAVWE
ncbi:VPS10 domain-containing protein [Lacihabitans sp. CS3-21]|uniref:WD40/YVTN/BNR-like repeat-containing protein n=1 Tax=Lacihabitans sp. CS3-21 TaxID=2487332 RepID=UPI0020CBB142|nr:glycosyl hydrolase [Lacihabitans sp. CS3-21]MCP9748932.1 glycosyl hydrolase [Lacihabitans sp. CS3-21]